MADSVTFDIGAQVNGSESVKELKNEVTELREEFEKLKKETSGGIDVRVNESSFTKNLNKLQSAFEKFKSSSVIELGGASEFQKQLNQRQKSLQNFQNYYESIRDQLSSEEIVSAQNIFKSQDDYLRPLKEAVSDIQRYMTEAQQALSGTYEHGVSMTGFDSYIRLLNDAKDSLSKFGISLDNLNISNFDSVMSQLAQRSGDVAKLRAELKETVSDATNYLAMDNVDTEGLIKYKEALTSIIEELSNLGVTNQKFGTFKTANELVNQLTSEITKLKNAGKIAVSDMISTDGVETYKKQFKDVGEAVEYIQNLLAGENATVTTGLFKDESSNVVAFTVNVKRATGEIENLYYALNQVEDDDTVPALFSYTKGTENDSGAIKQLKEISAYAQKAKSDLAQLDASSANMFKGTEKYTAVETAIKNLENGIGTIQDVKNAFSELNIVVNNTKQDLRDGKGLNIFQNAKVDAAQMTTEIADVENAFKNLAVQPEELRQRIENLKKENTDFQKQTVSGSSEWVNSYKNIRTELNSITSEIQKAEKSTGAISLDSLSSSGVRYIEDFSGSIDEVEAKLREFQNNEGWLDFKINEGSIKTVNDKVTQLTVTYKDAAGAVKEFTMAQAQISTGGEITSTGLVQTSEGHIKKTASQAYAEQIEQERKETDAAYEQMYKELIDWNSKISSSIASFEGASQKQQNSLSAYTGLNSDSLNEARQYEKEYRLILNDLKTAYNSETGVIDTDMLKAMGWDDTQIANVEQELSNLAASFSATMSQVKREAQGLNFSKIFSDLNTGTFSKQIESLKQQMNNIVDPEERETIAALISELERLQQEMQDSKQAGEMAPFVDSYNQFNEVLKATSNELNTYKSNMGEAEASAKKMAQTVESVAKLLNNGTYSSTSESLKSQLTMFDGFDSAKIAQLRQYSREYEDLYNKLKSSYDTETGQFLIPDKEVVSTKQKLDDLKTSYSNLLKEIKADAGTSNISKMLNDVNAGKYISQVDQLREKINSLGSNVDTSGLQSIQNELDAIAAEMFQAASEGNFDGVNKSVQEFNAKLKEANASLTDLGLGGDGGGGGGNWINTLFNQLSSGFSQISKIVGTGFITRELRSAASEMVSTVEEIDSAMAQLQIVTSATDSEMTEFLESSIDLAKELGQSVSDVLGTIETYSRLGYSLEDSSVLAEYSSILSNVAGVDIEDATSGMTSVIKGFDLSVQDSEHVADVLVEVGQNYAVSASEILEAFEKSSAALAATGSTFEESAAIIAAGEQHCLENTEMYIHRTRLNALVA